MNYSNIPLKEVSINDIYFGETAYYEIPIYQRNYAWEKEEISALIQDVYDAFIAKRNIQASPSIYYIGTLVSHYQGDSVYEIIDGQQRLTTINLILNALGIIPKNKLGYRARSRSNETILNLGKLDTLDEPDQGIINGYRFAQSAILEIIPSTDLKKFEQFFLHQVHLIHYKVPKDIDLNHYFEIMNSRGEQLEKHEIVKARMMQHLNDAERDKFQLIWDSCSDMSRYVQQHIKNKEVFGVHLGDFIIKDFDHFPELDTNLRETKSILEILSNSNTATSFIDKPESLDVFQPIIDFPNFLLMVLKLVQINHPEFFATSTGGNLSESTEEQNLIRLDDKELLHEFQLKANMSKDFVKVFAFTLLKSKYLLDNYIVHHANEEETQDNHPWKLQKWQFIGEKENRTLGLKNTFEGKAAHDKLVQLLSMFEVSFTARQRKNYLLYCLQYLIQEQQISDTEYLDFCSNLARGFYECIYLDRSKLNDINVPLPGSFDETFLTKMGDQKWILNMEIPFNQGNFDAIYGNGEIESKGIPIFVFNYLDYLIWLRYAETLQGEKIKEGSKERKLFFEEIGCSDFGLSNLRQFYFSRTRRSLEHYFPQAAIDSDINQDQIQLNHDQINCFGNYAMIGNEANSSGSNWTPKFKRDKYLDASQKVNRVSIASLKFLIMLQICKDNEHRGHPNEWLFEDMQLHQKKMVSLMQKGIALV